MKKDHSVNVLWEIINVYSENHTKPIGVLWKKCIAVHAKTGGTYCYQYVLKC